MRYSLVALVMVCGFAFGADEIPKDQPSGNEKNQGKQTPTWHLSCKAHGYQASLTGPWYVMVPQKDVVVKGREYTYEIPENAAVSALRSGKGQTLGIFHKDYSGSIASEADIISFFKFLMGDDQNKVALDRLEVHIISKKIEANGNGVVLANLKFPPGFGDARDGVHSLGSILLCRTAEKPLLTVLGINFSMEDDHGMDLPLVYPSVFEETKNVFVAPRP